MSSLILAWCFSLLRLLLKLRVSPLATSLRCVIKLPFEDARTMAWKVVRTNPLFNVFTLATGINQLNRHPMMNKHSQVNKYPQANKHLQVSKYPRDYLRASDCGWASSRDAFRSSRTNL